MLKNTNVSYQEWNTSIIGNQIIPFLLFSGMSLSVYAYKKNLRIKQDSLFNINKNDFNVKKWQLIYSTWSIIFIYIKLN